MDTVTAKQNGKGGRKREGRFGRRGQTTRIGGGVKKSYARDKWDRDKNNRAQEGYRKRW